MHVFREEQNSLEQYFREVGVKVKNEMADDTGALIAKALKEDADLASSEDEVVGVDRGSADEDEESADDDFNDDSDSDVAEEYDSQHASSGGSDDDDDAADDGDAMDVDEEEVDVPPKKKSKTKK